MADKVVIKNEGTRRIIVGPPAKSSGSKDKMIKFDGRADSKVDVKRRIGSSHEITAERAKDLKKSRTLQEVGEKIGLTMG